MVIVSSIMGYLRRRHEDRVTRRLLHSMTDHVLHDIGVRRDQIDTLALERREAERRQAAARARGEAPSAKRGFGNRDFAPQH